jgi:hypothetical protein
MINKLLAICLIGTAKLKGSDDILLLQAIAQVESGNDDMAYNPKCGAKGRYQMIARTWGQHCDWPHSDAHDKDRSFIVAMRHIAWLKKYGKPTGRRQLIAMWRYGICGWSKADADERIDYVDRVNDIYLDISSK